MDDGLSQPPKNGGARNWRTLMGTIWEDKKESVFLKERLSQPKPHPGNGSKFPFGELDLRIEE